MENLNETKRVAKVHLNISKFELPPFQDVLVIGKNAPIGMNAIKRVIDFISQGLYSVIPVEGEGLIEAVVVKNDVLKMLPKKKLIDLVKKEVAGMMQKSDIFKIKIEIEIHIKKDIQL